MSGNTTVIFPKDTHYRVSAETAIRCIHLLQNRGVIGGPLRDGPEPCWRPGSLCEVTLGVHFVQDPHGPGSIRVDCPEKPRLYVSLDFSVKCPACGGVAYGGRIDRCSHLLSAFAEHPDDEPGYSCDCGTTTPISRLDMEEGTVARFAIVLTDATRPLADTSLPFWSELEQVLGTSLGYFYYTRP